MTHPVTVVCLICTKMTQKLKIIKRNLVNNTSWSISVELNFLSRTKSVGCHRSNSVEMFILGFTFFGCKYFLVELGRIFVPRSNFFQSKVLLGWAQSNCFSLVYLFRSKVLFFRTPSKCFSSVFFSVENTTWLISVKPFLLGRLCSKLFPLVPFSFGRN